MMILTIRRNIMDTLEEILAIAPAALGALGTILGLIISLVKNQKAKKNLLILQQITDVLQKLVVEAEQYTNFTGEEKKEYVMTKANLYALKNKWKFDEAAVSEIVEEMISLSKSVNQRDQDKVAIVATATETAMANSTTKIKL